ncbi:hypothetical protein [EBPR siphovirus 5]|nr:hypothetical protein [EBPR siphovirus 5]
MPYAVTMRHVDTCLPCYVQDHCNGESECLVGVPVSRADRVWHVRQCLEFDVSRGASDSFPEDMLDSEIQAAIADAWRGAHPLKAWDRTLERATAESDEMGESCYSWFRFEWERI